MLLDLYINTCAYIQYVVNIPFFTNLSTDELFPTAASPNKTNLKFNVFDISTKQNNNNIISIYMKNENKRQKQEKKHKKQKEKYEESGIR